MLLEYYSNFFNTIDLEQYKIIIVANVKGKTKEDDNYPDGSITAEFMTISNFERLVQGFRDIGLETTAYFDENCFMNDCISDNLFQNKQKKVMIYNTAQNGTRIGRKSLIPAFCYQNNIMICGSNPYVVSLTRHKYHCDQLLAAAGIRSPQSYFFTGNSNWFLDQSPKIGEMVLAKLNYEASSIGMSNDNLFSYNTEQISFLNRLSDFYRQPIDVQQYISGYELEVPCIRNSQTTETTFPVGIEYKGKRFLNDVALTYDIRMKKDYEHYNYYDINPKLAAKIEDTAKLVMEYINIQGFGRIDFRVDENLQFYVTDIAAHPGIGPASAFVYSFQKLGYSFQDLLKIMFTLTLEQYHLLSVKDDLKPL